MKIRPGFTLRTVLAFVSFILLIFILTLIIIPSNKCPLKSYLESQKLLESSVSFFGIVTSGIIAGLILTVVNERIQTYSWRRDQALKDVDKIYEPLYWDVSRVSDMVENLSRPNYPSQVESWDSIKSAYLGTKLRLIQSPLYNDLERLFSDFPQYATRHAEALNMVHTLARNVIEKKLDNIIKEGN